LTQKKHKRNSNLTERMKPKPTGTPRFGFLQHLAALTPQPSEAVGSAEVYKGRGRSPGEFCRSCVEICSFWHKTNSKLSSSLMSSYNQQKFHWGSRGRRLSEGAWSPCPP